MGNRCCSKAYSRAGGPVDDGKLHIAAAPPQPGLIAAFAAAGLAALPSASYLDAAWLSSVVQRVWPHFSQSLGKVVLEDVQGKIREYLPAWAVDKVRITRFSVRSNVPTLAQVAATRGADGLVVEAALGYSSDLDFAVAVGRLNLGMSSVKATGHIKVTLGPLVGDVPVIGAASFTFVDAPDVQFKFTALAELLEHSPLVKNVIRVALDGIIAREAVSPNALVIPLVDGLEGLKLGLASPIGVLRTTAVRAGGLTAADWHLVGKNTSDPYLRVRVADQQWTSPTVKRTVDPEWTKDNTYDFVVYDAAQRVLVDVYDQDLWTGDDYLGCLAPLKLDEALVESGRQLPVFESRQAVGNSSNNRGHLEMQWVWLAPVTASMDVHGNLMTEDIIVVAEVSGVDLPASFKGSMQIRIKVGSREEVSKCLRPAEGEQVAAAVAASGQAFHDIVHRSAKEGLGVNAIAHITALDRQTVALLLKEETAPASKELASKLTVSLPFNTRLCIPVSAATTKKEPLVLELVEVGTGTVATASLTFRDIGLGWPAAGKPGVVQLRGPSQLTATMGLTVTILGLKAGHLV